MNPMRLSEDLEPIAACPLPWERLRNKRIFITGATGFIGSYLVEALCWLDSRLSLGLKIGLFHRIGFKHSNTTERTLMAAAKLVGMGVEFTKIINTSFYEKSYVQNQILGRALLESVVFYHGSCIFSALKLKDLDFYGVGPSDLGGIVDQLIVTEGIRCAIFLYEIGQQKFKVSMRSKEGIDVSQVAMHFGGGGHIRAAGCEMMGSVYDVINNLSARIALQIGEEPDSAEVMAEEEPCTAE